MLDDDSISLCSECLAAAATDAASESEVQLIAVAFARDLVDTGFSAAGGVKLLDAAYADAVARIDASELDHDAFASGLRALTELRTAITAELLAAGDGGVEIVAAS
jgi:hypothetical protein